MNDIYDCTYTPAEIRSVLLRRYKKERENRFTNHEDAITLTGIAYTVEREKVKSIVNPLLDREREENILAASLPGEAAEQIVPDTFPEEWV